VAELSEHGWPQASVLTGDTALILAGGEGSRLRHSPDAHVRSQPKLLVEICPQGVPVTMLDHVVSGLAAIGIGGIAVVTAPDADFGDAIDRYVMSRADWKPRPAIIRERERRGTGMAVCAALRCVYSATVVVLPGDILFPFHALPPALLAHEGSGYPVTWTITTHQDPAAQNFGRIICDATRCRVSRALEGPAVPVPPEGGENDIRGTSAGAVIFSREPTLELFCAYLAEHPRMRRFDLYRDFLPWVIGGTADVGYYDVRERVDDLGTPERLARFGRPPGARQVAGG
jgi:NDP-sugar pyrophosphorylase family protein